MSDNVDTGMVEVRKAVPSLAWLARRLGITRGAISQWPRVPAERVIDVERESGVSRAVIRPDLYPEHAFAPSPSREEDGAPAASCPVPSSSDAAPGAVR